MALSFIRSPGCAALLGMSLFITGCATPAPQPAELKLQVAAAERAFARTMATRDHAAFVAFLADDAIFFAGTKPLRGKAQVAAAWQRFSERPEPPFSWEPAEVEVLGDGTLALSSGPVRDANGKLVATFTSIWRQESPGIWRVVFDKGNDACDCATPP
jgi:ketosteroid isomerase-like protein